MEKVMTTSKIRQTLMMAGATLALGGVMFSSNTTQAEASAWDERPLEVIQLDIQETKEAESIEYQIQWGDTLGNIAKALGMEVSTLANANGIGNIDVIIAGQYLVISEDSEGHTEVKVQNESSQPKEEAKPEVKPASTQPKEEAKPEVKAQPKEQPKEEAKPEVKAQAPVQKAQPVQATTSAHEAFNQVVAEKGVSQSEANHWAELIRRESNWKITAKNPSSGAYGLPQSLPGNKMASHGSDWQTNPVTQLNWMFSYVQNRYGSFAAAIQHSNNHNWY